MFSVNPLLIVASEKIFRAIPNRLIINEAVIVDCSELNICVIDCIEEVETVFI